MKITSKSCTKATFFCMGYPHPNTLRFLKKGHPQPLFSLFSSFLTNISTNNCEKCPYGAGIRTHDLQNTSLLP